MEKMFHVVFRVRERLRWLRKFDWEVRQRGLAAVSQTRIFQLLVDGDASYNGCDGFIVGWRD